MKMAVCVNSKTSPLHEVFFFRSRVDRVPEALRVWPFERCVFCLQCL